MRHGVKFRKLGRGPVQRHTMLRRLATALVKHERIVTTLARAKELRRVGDRVSRHAQPIPSVMQTSSITGTRSGSAALPVTGGACMRCMMGEGKQ